MGIALAFAAALTAADGKAESNPRDRFHINANVVLINATVLGPHDRPVSGLPRDQFRVFEDRAEERIAYFSEEEVPLSLAVIFDVSGSMQGKLPAMRAALNSILEDANPGDEISLITFSDRPEVEIGWSLRPEEIQNRLLEFSAHGQTSLLDALRAGMSQMKSAHNPRKALVIFSDGGDNHSRSSEREILHSLEEADVQIYAIDTTEPWISHTPDPEEFAGPDLLERICDQAGGRYFQADGRRELRAAAQQISRELRSQYLIGYVPSGPANDGRFHHVRVQLKRNGQSPKLTVFWRKGYRAAVD